MSAETKAALDDAIAAHIAEETDGNLVTGYTLIASNTNAQMLDDEETAYYWAYAEQQPFHVSLGLVHRHRLMLERVAS